MDLLVGIANVPVRVLETCWNGEDGPDSLELFLSSGRNFRILWLLSEDSYGVYERGVRLDSVDEWMRTGLSRMELNALGRKVWGKWREDMAQVDRSDE